MTGYLDQTALADGLAAGFAGQWPCSGRRTPRHWSLDEAAKPYKGTTIRIIGEALAPLGIPEPAEESAFEEETGIKVEIEQHAFDQVIQKTTADFVGRPASTTPSSTRMSGCRP